MLRLLLISTILMLISACGLSSKSHELKSPCVSITNDDGTPAPCVKRPVNGHMFI